MKETLARIGGMHPGVLKRLLHATAAVLMLIVAAVSSPAQAQERTVLGQDQAREFVLKGPFTAVRDGGDRSIKFDFRSDGTVFQNTFRSGKPPMSSSGSWRMNDNNGKVCVEFSDVDTKGVCFGVIRGGSTVRLYTGKRDDPVIWATVQ